MSKSVPLAGIKLLLDDGDDPIILVREVDYNVNRDGHNPEHVEVLVVSEEGVAVYLKLSYDLAQELYEKMGYVMGAEDS